MISTLTKQETNVLGYIAEGFQNKEIAYRMQLTEHTVKVHVNNIMTKVKCGNRLELIVKLLAGKGINVKDTLLAKTEEQPVMERTLESASMPIMFICESYQLPHAPVYWLADAFLCAFLLEETGPSDRTRTPSGSYSMQKAISEIEVSLNNNGWNAVTVGDIVTMVETAVKKRFK